MTYTTSRIAPTPAYTTTTLGNERLGIPAIQMNDGPQGFRVSHQEGGEDGTSTQFPSGLTVGATWDPELAYKWGK